MTGYAGGVQDLNGQHFVGVLISLAISQTYVRSILYNVMASFFLCQVLLPLLLALLKYSCPIHW